MQHNFKNKEMKRQSIMETYKELQAVKNMAWPSNTPSITPDPMVMECAERDGRREALLFNNRIHWIVSGDGKIIHTGLAKPEQYDVNREWILKNYPK